MFTKFMKSVFYIVVKTMMNTVYSYDKTLEGGNIRGFRGFSLNRECFPMNYGLVDWQCKSTSMLPLKFSRKWKFCTLTVKVFSLESFAVYSKG